MAKKYGFLYVAKQVLKGVTVLGIGELSGYLTETACRNAGCGKAATFAAKVAGFTVGAMIAKKTGDYLDGQIDEIKTVLLNQAKSMEEDSNGR